MSYYYLQTDDKPDSGIPYWDSSLGKAQGKPAEVKQGTYYGWKDRDFQKQENHIGTIKLEHDLTDNITITNTAMYAKSKMIMSGQTQMTQKVMLAKVLFGIV